MIRHRTCFILSTLVVGRLPFTNDTASNRFHSFHFGRRQATKYYNVLSNFISLFSGVPQDSILRPSLFTLCISDVLNKKSRGCVVAFAEDLTLMCVGIHLQMLLYGLKMPLIWSSNRLLITNSFSMLRNVKPCSPHISLGNHINHIHNNRLL